MAHEVRAKIDTKVVTGKDLEIVVKTSAEKLGTLLISKGNIEWLPRKLRQQEASVVDKIRDTPRSGGKD